MRTLKEKDIVRHFKGGLYQILNFAKHTETGDVLVIYESLEGKGIFARPYDMFMGVVDKEKYPDCEQYYRLELVCNLNREVLG